MTTVFDSALPSRGESRDEDVACLRVPPQSIEAEQSVLGGLLLDNGAWDRAADVVTEADFYRFEHKIIFGAIGALIGASKPADEDARPDELLKKIGELTMERAFLSKALRR